MTAISFARRATVSGAMAAALALALALAPAQAAQPAHPAQPMKTAGEITETVTVVSFDPASRRLVVRTASGQTEAMTVPAEAHNAENLKPGDRIKATYRMEAAFTLVPRGKAAAKDTEAVVTSRSAKGQLPGGHIANHMVVTGAVLAVDNAAHTVKLVNPSGGEVHNIYVPSEDGRALMRKLKPGDKITAEVSGSLLISTERG